MPNDASPAPTPTTGRRAWVTLLTRSSYLPGALLLAHSLQRVRSAYPLIVLVSDSLDPPAVDSLRALDLEVHRVEPLRPKVPVSIVAERFADTWDKLRVFGMEGFERVVLLDGDMLVLQNMDDLFDMPLPEDWIAANHACVCNWGRDAWAPDDWRPWNCGYTPVAGPRGAPTQLAPGCPRPHTLLNSGLVVLQPSARALGALTAFLHTSPLVPTFSFPDQDLLAALYAGRWRALPWTDNAIKTARYWHPNLWADGAVRNLHYIVDKPWARTRKQWADHDAVTHGWWWAVYYEWRAKLEREGQGSVVKECERWMLGRKGEKGGETGVGEVESWEESIRRENEGRAKGYTWPPGEEWNVEVNGVRW